MKEAITAAENVYSYLEQKGHISLANVKYLVTLLLLIVVHLVHLSRLHYKSISLWTDVNMYCYLSVRMCSKGYSSWVVCVSVCPSVKPHLTSGVSVRTQIDVTYSTGNKGKDCGVFSETASLQRSSTPSIVWPYIQAAIFPAESTHAH